MLRSLSSIQTFENGRRYHAYKAGKYYQPNDEEEMDREDMKHHWFKLVMNGQLHLAPIGDKPGRILDLGTGTGIWCVEMGDRYPSARIIGTDLSKIQPTWVPPNVSFEIDDFDDEWTYGDNVFDLVHNRFNTTAVNNWPRQFRKAFDALKPGGFIEVVDITNPPQSDDGSIPEGSQLLRFFEHLTDGCKQVGRDLRAMYEWRRQLEEAGYVNIQERVLKVPIGGWPKDRRLKEAGVFELETLRVRLRPKYQGHLLILIVNFAYRGIGRFTGYRPWLLHTCAEMEGRGS
jgi:SAM-dependent methyltransferase